MKISLNWLKEYVDVKVPDDELIRLIGARLVEVEGVIDETHKYDKIKVVKVETAEKIPDTHLTLCQINDGGAELVQVVCGAPNVRVGMLAAWIAPGAIVPASVHEDAPFVIGKRKMLGKYDSNGMLAGADELDFGGDHSGIVEIDPEMAKPGDLLADVFNLNDLILEIENKSLTHRPDCFGIIGFAREVHGILGISEPFPFARGLEFLSTSYAGTPGEPSLRDEPLGSGRNIGVKNSNLDIILSKENGSDICRRYTAIVLEKHGELEKKFLTLKDTLIAKSGMKPVDPIVDATNYLMLLTGQPLHAFDYDKFLSVGKSETAKIGVRLAKKGEKLELLDGKVIECEPFDILVTSNDVPVALAGAMGGTNTAVDENTKNILLESATFSLYNLRKTQMAHGIFSEAITRFTKGQPASQTLEVAEACAEMLSTGFRVSAVADEYPNPEKPIVVKITADEINDLLGTNYDKDLIVKTLEDVGFGITSTGDAAGGTPAARSREASTVGEAAAAGPVEQLVIESPIWRTDIHIKEDIIEEVGRLLGYENIQLSLPLHDTANRDEIFEFKHEVRDLLAKFGANEVLTYSFVSEKLLEKAGLKKSNSYKIVNSISPDLQLVRQTIVPSLLDKAYLNIKLPVDKFAIFEMNKVYQKDLGLDDEEVPVEKINLGFVVAERKNSETAFYKAKKYLDLLLKHFGVNVSYVPLRNHSPITQPFEPKRSAEVVLENGEVLGVVGEFKNSVKNDFKLGDYTAGFEIDLEISLERMNAVKKIDLRKKEIRDLTVKTNKTYSGLTEKIAKIIDEAGLEAEILPGTIYQPENADEKSMTVRLEFTKFDEKIMPILENL